MNRLALRELVLQSNLAAHGVDITVTRPAPDHAPIATTGIWATPESDDLPSGLNVQRRDMRRVLVIAKSAVPTLPLNTLVVAVERADADAERWRVVGFDRIEAEHWRVVVSAESC